MSMPQVIEGTGEEIAAVLNGSACASRKMRVVIEPEEVDFTDDLPDPPSTVRDAEHLNRLLLDGFRSPSRELTEADWQELHSRAQSRIAGKAS